MAVGKKIMWKKVKGKGKQYHLPIGPGEAEDGYFGEENKDLKDWGRI